MKIEIIDNIKNHGFKNITISVNYLAKQLIDYFGENRILTLLSSRTNAKFRVGFDCTNQNINDIIFTDIFNNFEKFRKQLIKYLNYIK